MFNNTKTYSEIAKEVVDLYRSYGSSDYIGEKITQSQHAIQCGLFAKNSRGDDTLVFAAFLHDIGHLIGIKQGEKSMIYNQKENMGIIKHELLGAEYLRELGFPDKMCDLVGMHVLTKRYLCTVDDSYINQLSEASRKTFELQGGKLSEDDLINFQNNEYFDDAIKLRHYDDEGKMENYPPARDINKHLDYFEKKIILYLETYNKQKFLDKFINKLNK